VKDRKITQNIDYLFITNSLSGGGAERAINIAVNEISKKYSSIGLLVINDGPHDLYAPNVPTFEIKRKWQGGVFSLLVAFFKTYYLILRLQPKVIILNCDLPEFLGAFMFGTWKIVVVEHAPNPWHTRIHIGSLIRRILAARNVRWVKVSEHLKVWKIDSGSVHIPNAISALDDAPVNKHLVGDTISRLVFIGRLAKIQKQPHWMLEIAHLTKLPLVFIGEGTYKSELLEDSRKLNSRVDFLGYRNDPWDIIKPGDLLIVPSAWEGDGLVVIEAISRGVPLLLNKVEDLTRFELPPVNYCSNVKEFANRVIEHRTSLNALVVNDLISKNLTESRSSDLIAMQWINFLTKLA
jgi:hypothetical protein